MYGLSFRMIHFLFPMETLKTKFLVWVYKNSTKMHSGPELLFMSSLQLAWTIKSPLAQCLLFLKENALAGCFIIYSVKFNVVMNCLKTALQCFGDLHSCMCPRATQEISIQWCLIYSQESYWSCCTSRSRSANNSRIDLA